MKPHRGHDPDDCAPECAWCGLPAAEQIDMGSHRPNDDGWQRLYAWLCSECAESARQEKETSQRV